MLIKKIQYGPEHLKEFPTSLAPCHLNASHFDCLSGIGRVKEFGDLGVDDDVQIGSGHDSSIQVGGRRAATPSMVVNSVENPTYIIYEVQNEYVRFKKKYSPIPSWSPRFISGLNG